MTQSIRKRLPDERASITHRFKIDGHKGYMTVGKYPDGTPGEVFLVISKGGSTLSGMARSFAIMISKALQRGEPIESVVSKLAGVKYEPSGFTKNECIRRAHSFTDYVALWLGMKFVDLETLSRVKVETQCHDCGKTVVCDGKTYACIAEILKRPPTQAPPSKPEA